MKKISLISLETAPSSSIQLLQEILLRAGYDCNYIYLPIRKDAPDQEIDDLVNNYLKDLCKGSLFIGVSMMTNTYPIYKKLAARLKSLKIPIIAGGIHPTVKPEECLEDAQYVCIGEAEDIIVPFAKFIESKKKYPKIDNICYMKNGKLIKNRLALACDLNSLPIHNLDFEKQFFYHDGKISKLTPEIRQKYYSFYYYVITSRGCPYRCWYCLNDTLIKINPQNVRIRRRSTDHVIEELKIVKKQLGDGITIGFVDDDFCAKPDEEMEDFCKRYKKEIGLKFFCATTPTSMTKRKIEALIDAGLIRLETGIQSISDKTNKEIYHRFALKKNVVAAVKLLAPYRHKVEQCFDFIFDNPWETEEAQVESIEFILSMKKPVTVYTFSLTLYPGTALYELGKKDGIIKDEKEQVYAKDHMVLANHYLNTVCILYTKFNMPKPFIRWLLKHRQNKILRKLLWRTTLLHKAYNYFYGVRHCWNRRDWQGLRYYLWAPFSMIGKKIMSVFK
jgi:radical SAM superfamily enzyme YgiQ (UPF0313 family)